MPPTRSLAVRRYLLRLILANIAYLITVFLTFHVFYQGRMPLPEAVGFAIIPSIPILAIIVVVALYLREEKDEFQREIFIQSLLWAAGGTLAVTSFWSFLHLMGHVPAVDGFHVWVLFWTLNGLSALPIRRYYSGGSDD